MRAYRINFDRENLSRLSPHPERVDIWRLDGEGDFCVWIGRDTQNRLVKVKPEFLAWSLEEFAEKLANLKDAARVEEPPSAMAGTRAVKRRLTGRLGE